MENKIVDNNLLTQQLEEAKRFDSDTLRKADNWRSRININKVEGELKSIKEAYYKAERAHNSTLEASLRNKKELDKELMRLFDVGSLDKLKYQWIEAVLTKGSLEDVMYKATESEQEILNSARARLTSDKVDKLKVLTRNQGISMGKVEVLKKEMEDKKKSYDQAEKTNSQASIDSYKKKVEKLQKLHQRVKEVAAKHDEKIKALKERQAQNVERIKAKQKEFKDNVEESTNVVTNFKASVANVSFTGKMMLVEKMVEEGNISEQKAAALLKPYARSFQLSITEQEALSDTNKVAYDRCGELYNVVDNSMDLSKDTCDNPIAEPDLSDRAEITSLIDKGGVLLKGLEMGELNIENDINALAEMSISNQLDKYEQMSRDLTRSMEKVQDKFNMPDLSKYSENQLEDALKDMEKKIEDLEKGDAEIEKAFEETSDKTSEVEAKIDATIEQNNEDSAGYTLGSNTELVKEFDRMIALSSSCEHMPQQMQEAYTQYIWAQVDELKMSSKQASALTGQPVPTELKDKVNTIEEQLKKQEELETENKQNAMPVLEYKPRDDEDD